MHFVVKDRYTKREIYRGTKEECRNFIAAFKLCFMEPLVI